MFTKNEYLFGEREEVSRIGGGGGGYFNIAMAFHNTLHIKASKLNPVANKCWQNYRDS